jgi:hypothetical protein
MIGIVLGFMSSFLWSMDKEIHFLNLTDKVGQLEEIWYTQCDICEKMGTADNLITKIFPGVSTYGAHEECFNKFIQCESRINYHVNNFVKNLNLDDGQLEGYYKVVGSKNFRIFFVAGLHHLMMKAVKFRISQEDIKQHVSLTSLSDAYEYFGASNVQLILETTGNLRLQEYTCYMQRMLFSFPEKQRVCQQFKNDLQNLFETAQQEREAVSEQIHQNLIAKRQKLLSEQQSFTIFNNL